MDLDDVFKKAAIGVAFDKSSILQNIKHEQYATHDLVKLLNMYNSHSMAEIPIIVVKFVTRLVATTMTNKFTVLQKYINPENIDISIAPDELNFIINNHKPVRTSNIVFIVAKNILTSLFGISASNLDQQLLKLIESTKPTEAADDHDATNPNYETKTVVEAMITASSDNAVDDDHTIKHMRVPSVVSGGFGSVYSPSSSSNSISGSVHNDNITGEEYNIYSRDVKLIDKFKRLEDLDNKRSYSEAFEGDADGVDNHPEECSRNGDSVGPKRLKTSDYNDDSNADIDSSTSPVDSTNEIPMSPNASQTLTIIECMEHETDDDNKDDSNVAVECKVKTLKCLQNNANAGQSPKECVVVAETVAEYEEIDISEEGDDAADDDDDDDGFNDDDDNDDDDDANNDDDDNVGFLKPKIIDDVFVNKKIILNKNAPSFSDAISAGNYVNDLLETLACDKAPSAKQENDVNASSTMTNGASPVVAEAPSVHYDDSDSDC